MFSAAVDDPRTAAHLDAFVTRWIGPRRLLAPRPVLRATRVQLRRRQPPRWCEAATTAG